MVSPRIAFAFAGLVLVLARLAAAVPDAAAHAAVAATLAEHAPGIRLLSATLDGERLTVDLGGEAFALRPGSPMFALLTRRVQFAADVALRERLTRMEIELRIAGTPLPELIVDPAASEPVRAAAPASPIEGAPPRAALNGRRIALSPGHGYYLNGTRYVLQRSFFSGIVEDFVNHDFVTLVAAQLHAWGADVRPLRHLDRGAGDGETGFPRWQEAARYHVKALGADASVWNEAGFDHLDQDIRCRPRYANAIGAELLVSIHNNGGGGTGTETLYDTNHVAAAESRRLADVLHARIIAAIRRDYDPNWTDRLVKGFNGSYGENRLATRPAVIIEIAFMDRATPDNAALRDERFKQLVSAAIADGIREFVEGPVPAPPTGLAASSAAGGVTLTWLDNASNETGYRVQRREPAAEAWTTIATLPAGATNYNDTTVTGNVAHSYRVQAFNAAGVSGQASNEVTLGSPVRDLTPADGDGPSAWLTNLSLRTSLEAGRNVIVGFVVRPAGKPLLVRAAGPALAAFGLATAMADPRIELFSGGARVAQNNDWPAGLAPAFSSLGAFAFPVASRDAAVLQAIDGAGSAIVTGTAGGVVLVEGYDAGAGSAVRLVNLSARNRVGTGADALIAGFVIAGTGTQRVLIRAVGPGLAGFGVAGALADPRLEVRDGAGARIAENDNWDAGLASVFAQAGAFALATGSRDAATVLTLAAGKSYTVQVAGVGAATGEALVEVYEVP